MVARILKKLDRPQIIIYKRNFDENKHLYFLIKEGAVFIKYMEILEKIRNIIKNKFNTKLIYSKKYLKPEKNKYKRRLSVFLYTSNIG